MKRLCIYLVYDKKGQVDRYVGYMLKELKSCVDTLLVVCNQKQILKGREWIEPYADRIYMRDNLGFDAGAFKDVLCSLYGWKKVDPYEELLLVNDSFFGPFRSMKDILREMEERDLDFWGLTMHGGRQTIRGACCQEHIQSFFLAVRSRMLHSREFRDYWEEMPYYTTFNDVVRNHETVFTSYFGALGYRYGCLADMKPNDSPNTQNNYIQYSSIPYELIQKRNFPFFKKRQLEYDGLEMQTQESQMEALRYVDKETDYDVNMIWENIIRTLDCSDLYRSLHLHYVIEERQALGESHKIKPARCAILVRASWPEAAELVINYLEQLKRSADIFIVPNKATYELYKEKNFLCISIETKKEQKQWLEYLSRYFCIGVLEDADVTGNMRPSCEGKSYIYGIWENLAKNEAYIQRVIGLFDQEKNLGFLTAPQLVFGHYLKEIGTSWDEHYEKVQEEVKRMGLDCVVSPHKKPFAVTNNFWIRGKLLKRLFSNALPPLELWPYLWCYVAQDGGYYSAAVENAEYAGMEIINRRWMMDMLGDQVRRQYGDFDTFDSLRGQISKGALEKFCAAHQKLYLYGAGEMGKKYRALLPNIEAYVVSDGEPKNVDVDGEKVINISEVSDRKRAGIIVALNEKNRSAAIKVLTALGFEHYICI